MNVHPFLFFLPFYVIYCIISSVIAHHQLSRIYYTMGSRNDSSCYSFVDSAINGQYDNGRVTMYGMCVRYNVGITPMKQNTIIINGIVKCNS